MNPHSPTDSWLKAVVDNNGYESNPNIGDSGSMFVKRPSGEYEVTVEKVS
jgi:hypothetical protein